MPGDWRCLIEAVVAEVQFPCGWDPGSDVCINRCTFHVNVCETLERF